VPWAQIDDHFTDSEGALAAGVEACGLHLLATCWCAAQLSDGKLPALAARRLISGCLDNDGDELVARLTGAGLWERQDDDGYLLTDFLTTNKNRTREQVKAGKVDKAAAGRKGGLAKAAKRHRRPEKPSDESPEDEPDPDEEEPQDYLPF
jgi:hypothetical protein